MFCYRDTSDVAKKAAEVAQSNDWPMVSFICNGSEITTWMGYSCKTKSTRSRATTFTITPSFLIFNQQIIGLAQGHWSCTSSH